MNQRHYHIAAINKNRIKSQITLKRQLIRMNESNTKKQPIDNKTAQLSYLSFFLLRAFCGMLQKAAKLLSFVSG